MSDLAISSPASTLAAFGGDMSPAMALMLDERMFERMKQIATYLSKAEGFVPSHLLGKPEACFAVVTRAMVWRLDPFSVAQSTYQPAPGAKVAYEGKLVQAILESSGRLSGGVKFEHYGEWSKIQNKFVKKKSDKGKDYAVADWKDADESGLGVRVYATINGEIEPRELKFDLVEAFPRNSTLWATRPKQQICYTAVRAFASLVCPTLVMGVPFDVDIQSGESAIDVTPERPTRTGAKTAETEKPAETYFEVLNQSGEVVEHQTAGRAAAIIAGFIRGASPQDVIAIYEHNEETLVEIATSGISIADIVDAYNDAKSMVAAKSADASKPETSEGVAETEEERLARVERESRALEQSIGERLAKAKTVDALSDIISDPVVEALEKTHPERHAKLIKFHDTRVAIIEAKQ